MLACQATGNKFLVRLHEVLHSAFQMLTWLSYTTAIASVCQIAFYLETGGEIQWAAGASLASDPAGLALLLSGFPTFAFTFIVIVAASWLATPLVFEIVGVLITVLCSAFKDCRDLSMSKERQIRDLESDQKILAYVFNPQFLPDGYILTRSELLLRSLPTHRYGELS